MIIIAAISCTGPRPCQQNHDMVGMDFTTQHPLYMSVVKVGSASIGISRGGCRGDVVLE